MKTKDMNLVFLMQFFVVFCIVGAFFPSLSLYLSFKYFVFPTQSPPPLAINLLHLLRICASSIYIFICSETYHGFAIFLALFEASKLIKRGSSGIGSVPIYTFFSRYFPFTQCAMRIAKNSIYLHVKCQSENEQN